MQLSFSRRSCPRKQHCKNIYLKISYQFEFSIEVQRLRMREMFGASVEYEVYSSNSLMYFHVFFPINIFEHDNV